MKETNQFEKKMNRTRLIFVGGFLGAGKTTLLFEATRYLMEKGKRVGLVTNDQAPDLFDSALLLQTLANVAEVSGSCFCCNYNGLIGSLKKIKIETQPDVIIAEPVGSCTDLSATIMQPFKDLQSNDFHLSPLTVLADPIRLKAILSGGSGGLHPSAAYILLKQIEESDIIAISKSDILVPKELNYLKELVSARYPGTDVISISSKTGEGVHEWIEKVTGSHKVGSKIIQVDYDRYAEGEAVLGWLNASVSLEGTETDWDNYLRLLMENLSEKFDRNALEVGHVKIIIENGIQSIIGNLTGKSETLQFRGSAGISGRAGMIINARVETSPFNLEEIVKKALALYHEENIRVNILSWKCLSPGYPTPTYRYGSVVESTASGFQKG